MCLPVAPLHQAKGYFRHFVYIIVIVIITATSVLSHLYGLSKVFVLYKIIPGMKHTAIPMRAALAENPSSMQIANIQVMLSAEGVFCFSVCLLSFFSSSQSKWNVKNKSDWKPLKIIGSIHAHMLCPCVRAFRVNVIYHCHINWS